MSLSSFFAQYGLFVVQLLTAAVLLAAIVAIVLAISRKGTEEVGSISVRKLNEKFERMRDAVTDVMLDKKELKKRRRLRKREQRQAEKSASGTRGRIYVLDFKGDIHASASASLREEVSAIIAVATAGETVVLRLENAGGAVHEHGFAASQLLRLKAKQLKLIVSVDKIAASGGYLMACVADRILAAPFAVVGSIGVLMQLPNFHRWLESRGIDYEQVTAGRFKRTLTVFGENTTEARDKVQAELEDIHGLFKSQIAEHRPQVDLERVSTGEHWYGLQAIELRLVDELQTSDEFLADRLADNDIYRFEYKRKKTLPERVMAGAGTLFASWR